MDNYNYFEAEDLFARCFVIAKQCKMNWRAFQEMLIKSKIVKCLEDKDYDGFLYCFKEDISKMLYINNPEDEKYKYTYDDAYWVGLTSLRMCLNLRISFARLWSKLPIDEMLIKYGVYHEMDISQMEEYYRIKDKETSVLRYLSSRNSISLSKLSEQVGINIQTLKNYSRSDAYLNKATFKNVYALAKYFDVPMNLFIN